MAIDWQALFFENNYMAELDRMAHNRFYDLVLAEEAASYTLKCLSENNWERLSQFKGEAKPETYLKVVCGNYLEEYSRKKFGRPRPPKWLVDQGPLWVVAWKMMCIERQLQESVVDRLTKEFQREKQIVVQAIRTIHGKLPWCGHKHMEIPESSLSKDNDEEGASLIENQEDTGSQAFSEDASLIESLFIISSFLNQDVDTHLLLELQAKHFQDANHLEKAINVFHDKLHLSDDEIIVLRMIYQDGFKMKDIAQTLRLTHYQPGRIAKSALNKIKSALVKAGVDIQEVKNLVKTQLT